jgi:hypothetical protein
MTGLRRIEEHSVRIPGMLSITLLNAVMVSLYLLSLFSKADQVLLHHLVIATSYLSLALYCGRDFTDKSPDPALGVNRGSLLGAPLFAYSVYLLGASETALVAALMATLSFCLWLGIMAASE